MDAAKTNPVTATEKQADRASFWPQSLAGWFFALTRIIIGYMWFNQTLWKMPPTFGCAANFAFTTDIDHPTSGLCDFIGRQATYGAIEPYKAFLTGFVMPNIQLVGWGVYFMELAIAISLIFGILTRLGGLLGALQGINLAIGFIGVPHEWVWTYIFLVLLNLMFVAVAAGRYLGADHWLRRRFEGEAGLVARFVRLTT
ncbi:MAG: hypothetical protein U0768_14670 [Anaerolineae bacterium]